MHLLLQNHVSTCCPSFFIYSKGSLTSASVVMQGGEEAAQEENEFKKNEFS